MYFLLNFHSRNEEAEDAKKKTKSLTGLQSKSGTGRPTGEKTLAELSSEYDVHVNQIQTWRKQLKNNMVSLFDSGIDQRKDNEEQIQLLQAKIGR